jgi:hypothetical protein
MKAKDTAKSMKVVDLSLEALLVISSRFLARIQFHGDDHIGSQHETGGKERLDAIANPSPSAHIEVEAIL